MPVRWYSNPALVAMTPIVTTVLLDGANIGQIARMIHEHSAVGQSLLAWFMVWTALVLWWNFYRVVTPEARTAYWATLCGIAMNSSVILTVIYFRYLRHS